MNQSQEESAPTPSAQITCGAFEHGRIIFQAYLYIYTHIHLLTCICDSIYAQCAALGGQRNSQGEYIRYKYVLGLHEFVLGGIVIRTHTVVSPRSDRMQGIFKTKSGDHSGWILPPSFPRTTEMRWGDDYGYFSLPLIKGCMSCGPDTWRMGLPMITRGKQQGQHARHVLGTNTASIHVLGCISSSSLLLVVVVLLTSPWHCLARKCCSSAGSLEQLRSTYIGGPPWQNEQYPSWVLFISRGQHRRCGGGWTMINNMLHW